MGDTCIGDPDQLASLLEKASLEDDDRVHRLVPAGEVVYRVACPKKRYGATGGGNCSELLPVKELSPLGKLEGEQVKRQLNARIRGPMYRILLVAKFGNVCRVYQC